MPHASDNDLIYMTHELFFLRILDKISCADAIAGSTSGLSGKGEYLFSYPAGAVLCRDNAPSERATFCFHYLDRNFVTNSHIFRIPGVADN